MLRSDTATLSSHISIGSYVKKKLRLQEIQTERRTDMGIPIFSPKLLFFVKVIKKLFYCFKQFAILLPFEYLRNY